METTEPNRGTNPDAGTMDPPSRQTTAADDPTQPITLAPEPAQAPPNSPALPRPASAGEAPIGAALWLAFAFGVGVAIFWSLARTGLTQIDQSLQLSVIGGPRLPIFTLIAVSIDLALPVVIIVVAWRARRSADAPGIRSVVGALVALVSLTVGLGALVYALALTPITAPLGAALVDLLFPGYPVKFFASLSLDISAFTPSAIILALPAAYAWGGQWRRAATSSGNPRLVVVRWMAVGLSATLGYNVYQFAFGLIFYYFLVIPDGLSPQFSLFAMLSVYTFAPAFMLAVFGGVVGGTLSGVGGVGGAYRAEPIGAPTQAPQRPLGWGRTIAVGALLLALGLATSVWLPATMIGLTQAISAPSIPGLLGFAALVPTLILIVAVTAVFRRLGARSGWRTLGVAALSYAPLVVGVIGLGLLQQPDVVGGIILLLSDAPVTLLFGVGVALAVVYGAANPARWRGRAAAIGATLGVGYALLYTFLAVVGRTTSLGACHRIGGCGLQVVFNAGFANLLAGYALVGLALAVLGATVGGWLRARATH